MLGLGNNISKKMNIKANPIPALIEQFEARVTADAGTFESEGCLYSQLQDIKELIEQSSLIVTPNAIKASKIYAIKPIDGTDDLSVVRATTATRVNELGLIEQVPANVARLDYTNGICPSILIEPQRTNLLKHSEQFENSVWINVSGGTGVVPVRSANTKISPDGSINADTIVFNRGANNTISDQSSIEQYVVIPSAGLYTFSLWVKATNLNDVGKQIFIRTGNSSILYPIILTFSWTRVSLTQNITSATSNVFQIGNRGTITTGNNLSIDLYGAQLEAGANATSYIPTTTSAVTRNADVISKTGLSGITTITETFEDSSTNVISGIPTSYTMSQGRIKSVVGI